MPLANDFQMGRSLARELLAEQVGVEVDIPLAAINGHWDAPSDRFHATLLRPSHVDPFVAVALCDDGLEIDLTAPLLMRADVRAGWRPVRDALRAAAEAGFEHEKNAHATQRAVEIGAAVLRRGKGGPDPAEDVWLTLDGNGTNRRGFAEAAAHSGVPPPRVVTLEMDADVALAQRLLYGADVLFTGGDASLRASGLLGGSGKGKVGAEHVLLRGDLPDVDLSRVRLLYLDYCGGPFGEADRNCLADVFSRLPALTGVAVTMSKRQHADLLRTFDRYVPAPWGFREASTFLSNARVVCRLFLRDAEVPRRVAVPGWWWKHCPAGAKRKRFDGVVVGPREDGEGVVDVFFPADDACYGMRVEAVAHYGRA